MKYPSLYIDGIALYIAMLIFICLVLAVILFACSYIKEAREKDMVITKYKKIRSNYNKLIGMYHRDTFKVPDIEDTAGDK